ncbi:hypothetical protein CROQUDRAFT_667525 [Cronartium quercuum f. sp. fusiforme G11]|uniref:GYF domain-containing protein n=1 Tax=Cronartium quercuum f. sp. fusiforme G11 TaxID=708437 RepID=A0A9P6NRT5_9BASI|nr:hypothetical protein CROQUDRAFT_667525 [Cronartium quercuum f. sp. fusiforme G11]
MSNKRNLDASTLESPPVARPTTTKHKKVKFLTEPGPSAGRSYSDDGADDDLQFDELNTVGKVIKGRVKNEGYDSDSSTENADVREKKAKKEDDDMFGDEDEGPSKSDSKQRFEKLDAGMALKTGADAKEYLDLGDIEGQEFGKEDDDDEGDDEAEPQVKNGSGSKKLETDGESAEGYSDEEEDYVPGDEFANADDAPRARRKSKKGMGFLLSKFNMAEELTEGRMAADGSYVASVKDPEASHDNWLEGVDSKKAMKQAREAKKKLEEEIQKKAALQDQRALQRTRKDCYVSLLSLLSAQNGRSVSQTLSQLGTDKRTHQQRTRKKKVSKRTIIDDLVPTSVTAPDEMETDIKGKGKEQNHQPEKSAEQASIEEKIAEITDLASTLMCTHGDLDVYDMSHGTITGLLKSEGLVPRDWIPPSDFTPSVASEGSAPSNAGSNTSKKPLISRPTTSQQTSPPSLYYRFKPDPNNPSTPTNPPQIYGPFDRLMMQSWAAQGFFGPNCERVEVKLDTAPSGSSQWSTWFQILQ